MKIISWSVGFIPWGYFGRCCFEYRIYDNIVSNAVYKDTFFFYKDTVTDNVKRKLYALTKLMIPS